MTTAQTTESIDRVESIPWGTGILSGGIAGVGMGLLLHFQLFMFPLFGSLYGRPGIVGGAALHLVASLVFGVTFAVLVGRTRLRKTVDTPSGVVFSAIAYALVLWISVGAILLPLITVVTPPRALPLPYLSIDWIIPHLVYGVLLGATFVLATPAENDRE